eukprot:3532195-Lingulodinium_polyedra.AAC.1
MMLRLSSRPGCSQAAQQLIRFVACIIEQSKWIVEASDDALLAAVPKATRRHRVIGQVLKDAMAKAAAQGHLARTAQKVVRSVKRFRVRQDFLDPKAAGGVEKRRVARYLLQCQRTFKPA